jgi:predicted nicotinamide N-methyase
MMKFTFICTSKISYFPGGFKLWEGGIDLARYLVDTVFLKPCSSTKTIRVLELGCGHGLPGIVAMLAGATVDFQDYNKEVLEMLTHPSVMANWQANRGKDSPPPPVKYYSGDWGTLGGLLKESNLTNSYDIILTTETIYTLDGMNRLFQCIKQVNIGFVLILIFQFFSLIEIV